MKQVFYGFILLYLNINIEVGTGSLDLLPDFVGYILIAKGLSEQMADVPSYSGARRFALGTAAYFAVIYALNVLGLFAEDNIITFALGIVSTILEMAVYYQVIAGVWEIEQKYSLQLKSDKMKNMWTIMMVSALAAHVVFFVPFLMVPFLAAGALSTIAVLYYYYQAWKEAECVME